MFTTWVFAYLIFYNALQIFIYRRIKLVYKTISDLKSPRGRAPLKEKMSDNSLDEVDQEVRDWTESKTREIEELQKLETFRREFLGNVSHELKTPVFNIQGYIETLIDGGVKDHDINTLYLRRAAKNVERMAKIIGDLEVISLFESGALQLELKKFNILELAEDSIDSMRLMAGKRNIALGFKEGTKKVFQVWADREKIRQVLDNLLTNSIKYGKAGGETLIGFYNMDRNILIEVSDNGIGIEKVFRPRLFERFFRVDKARSKEHGGTGLGLSIVKHILEAHDQTINVRSSVDVGSTFAFTLKKA